MKFYIGHNTEKLCVNNCDVTFQIFILILKAYSEPTCSDNKKHDVISRRWSHLGKSAHSEDFEKRKQRYHGRFFPFSDKNSRS